MKKTTIRQLYYFSLVCHVFMLLCGILGCVFMIVYVKRFFMQGKPVFVIVFCISILILFLLLIALSLKTLTILAKDHKFLIDKEFLTVSGKVIGFARNRDPESGAQINDCPIIRVLDGLDIESADSQIVLHINDKVLIGETYVFRYLKYSKLAEVSQIK